MAQYGSNLSSDSEEEERPKFVGMYTENHTNNAVPTMGAQKVSNRTGLALLDRPQEAENFKHILSLANVTTHHS